MVDVVGFVLGVRHQFLELGDVLPCFAEVEGSEILVEAVVDEILGWADGYIIDIEIEGLGDVFGGFQIRNPEESVCLKTILLFMISTIFPFFCIKLSTKYSAI